MQKTLDKTFYSLTHAHTHIITFMGHGSVIYTVCERYIRRYSRFGKQTIVYTLLNFSRAQHWTMNAKISIYRYECRCCLPWQLHPQSSFFLLIRFFFFSSFKYLWLSIENWIHSIFVFFFLLAYFSLLFYFFSSFFWQIEMVGCASLPLHHYTLYIHSIAVLSFFCIALFFKYETLHNVFAEKQIPFTWLSFQDLYLVSRVFFLLLHFCALVYWIPHWNCTRT